MPPGKLRDMFNATFQGGVASATAPYRASMHPLKDKGCFGATVSLSFLNEENGTNMPVYSG